MLCTRESTAPPPFPSRQAAVKTKKIIPTRIMRALLLAVCVASLLATGVLAGRESSGELSCGRKGTWTVGAGRTKRCCTDPSLGSVDQFEYTVDSIVGGVDG